VEPGKRPSPAELANHDLPSKDLPDFKRKMEEKSEALT